ncbi:type II toxin-antitoxin system ParD family antitoxin, partial [Salmonella enterica]|uniref:type II toxin-antitoxin system ParD family antitoxin n=1 Tax=Salmonella enterica TaxID=28901 RepID=UPI001F4D1DA9
MKTNKTHQKSTKNSKLLTVDLGDELREFIESLIESGDYRTQSEVIRESLRLLREKQAESRL